MNPVQPIRQTRAKMDQHRLKLTLEHSDSGSSAINYFVEMRSGTIALPSAVPAEPAFGPSHSHRVWRMMNVLIDAKPEWTDQDTFEADRKKMLHYGLSTGMSLEELLRITDPDAILGLWAAAEAKEAEV
jgi:hypothetical protein